MGCPHNDIRACPLYWAGHIPGAPTCITGDWDAGCAVGRARDPKGRYAALTSRLERTLPGMCAHVEECFEQTHRREQQRRNLRLLRLS